MTTVRLHLDHKVLHEKVSIESTNVLTTSTTRETKTHDFGRS